MIRVGSPPQREQFDRILDELANSLQTVVLLSDLMHGRGVAPVEHLRHVRVAAHRALRAAEELRRLAVPAPDPMLATLQSE